MGTSRTAGSPRVAVIGAGAFGGWTALHLRRLGADVELIDAWGPGNTRSSSGGETRAIRAVYGADRVYVELVRRSYQMWEQLAGEAGEPLYVETGVLWLVRDDDSYVRSSAPILAELGFPLEQVAVADAARRWPQIELRGVQAAWFEHRAGALSARRACVAVQEAFVRAGGSVRLAHVRPSAGPQFDVRPEAGPQFDVRPGAGPQFDARFDDGSRLEADVYVFACGPWLGRLFPDLLGHAIRPTRQEIFYFGTPPGSDRYQPQHFPIWLDFGSRIFYGMPDLHGRGVKVADDTRGDAIDPSTLNRTPSADGLSRARHLLAERFPELANAPLLSAEVCQYENSPDGHLIVDRHPRAANVWLAGGGSGHGFKLSPAVGELLANAILAGRPVPEQFRLERLRAAEARTQFESR